MSSGGDLNPMMAGQRTHCIFGFCFVHNFGGATEVLQKDIMTFVNQIAEITHTSVAKCMGSPNKNIGEAFLLVWKFPNPQEFQTETKLEQIKFSVDNRAYADLSLFSFLKIIARINKFTHIRDYSERKELKQKIENWKVRMGFGLHQGWAIEGAIGSTYKIDASYLSPNVNMAARLEVATL